MWEIPSPKRPLGEMVILHRRSFLRDWRAQGPDLRRKKNKVGLQALQNTAASQSASPQQRSCKWALNRARASTQQEDPRHCRRPQVNPGDPRRCRILKWPPFLHMQSQKLHLGAQSRGVLCVDGSQGEEPY